MTDTTGFPAVASSTPVAASVACGSCGCRLQGAITGRNPVEGKGFVCDDCFYGELGDILEAFPVGGLGIRRG